MYDLYVILGSFFCTTLSGQSVKAVISHCLVAIEL